VIIICREVLLNFLPLCEICFAIYTINVFGSNLYSSFAGVFENVGIQPDVQRIGKYKSAGDQLTRKSMSKENCEMLTAILDNIYGNWLDKVSSTKGFFCLFNLRVRLVVLIQIYSAKPWFQTLGSILCF
jgi:protease-4